MQSIALPSTSPSLMRDTRSVVLIHVPLTLFAFLAVPLLPFPAVWLFLLLFPLGYGPAALARIAFERPMRSRSLELLGVAVAFLAPAFDLFMTLKHDPSLVREGNAVIRLLASRGQPESVLYIFGAVGQLWMGVWTSWLWIIVCRHHETWVTLAHAQAPRSALPFLRAAILGDGDTTPYHVLGWLGVVSLASALRSIEGGLSWIGLAPHGQEVVLVALAISVVGYSASLLAARDRLVERVAL